MVVTRFGAPVRVRKRRIVNMKVPLDLFKGPLFVLGECGLIRNPFGIGSNCLAFS